MLFLLACVPDHWSSAAEACAGLEAACEARLAEDFGAREGDLPPATWDAFQGGAAELLTWDLGPWPPPEDEVVHAPFGAWLEPAPGDDVAQRLYTTTADAIDALTYDAELPAWFRWRRDGEVSTDGTPCGPGCYAAALAHEAAHRDTPPHARCADGLDCDRGWDGAYALEAAVAHLALARCGDDEERCALLADVRCKALAHVTVAPACP